MPLYGTTMPAVRSCGAAIVGNRGRQDATVCSLKPPRPKKRPPHDYRCARNK